MAEIRVEKRKRPVWPWLLGLLGVLLIAFVILSRTDEDVTKNTVVSTNSGEHTGAAGGLNNSSNEQRSEATSPVDANETNGAECIERLHSLVQESKKQQVKEANYQQSGDHLKYLSCSLNSLLEKNKITDTNLQQQQDELEQAASAIESNQNSKDREGMLKGALKESVEILEAIQKKSYPDLGEEVVAVRQAANKIEATDQIREQKGQLDNFFEQTSEVLMAMKEKK